MRCVNLQGTCFVVNMDLYKLFFYNLFQFSGVFCLLIIIIG